LELGPEEKENSQNRSSIFGKEIRAGFQMGLLQNASNLISNSNGILKNLENHFLGCTYFFNDCFAFGLALNCS